MSLTLRSSLRAWRNWVNSLNSPAPQSEDPRPKGLVWLRSVDTTKTAKCGRGAAIHIDLDDNDNENLDDNPDDDDANADGDASSSEIEDAGLGSYELRQHVPGVGTSASGAVGQDLPEDAGQEKRQKVLHDKALVLAAAPACTATILIVRGKAAVPQPAHKPRARPAATA